jgi:hypothetical protein
MFTLLGHRASGALQSSKSARRVETPPFFVAARPQPGGLRP